MKVMLGYEGNVSIAEKSVLTAAVLWVIEHLDSDDQVATPGLDCYRWNVRVCPDLAVSLIRFEREDIDGGQYREGSEYFEAFFNLGEKPGTCEQAQFVVVVDMVDKSVTVGKVWPDSEVKECFQFCWDVSQTESEAKAA